MEFLQNVLRVMDWQMKTPRVFGWFHIACFVLTILFTVLLCLRHKGASDEKIRRTVLVTSVLVAVLEIYKQINYSFSYTDGISFDYQWYSFPWQFCSTPMYVGLLAGFLRKGKLRDALYSYLASFSVFAGLCVMTYPGDVFVGTVGINIQTMICHGSMIVLGVYLIYTGSVKLEHKSVLKAAMVFACTVGIAMVANEIAYLSGLLETETFNMFFISPHCPPSLPVYSTVQRLIPYPFSLVIYIAVFCGAAYLILMLARSIRWLVRSVSIHKKRVRI